MFSTEFYKISRIHDNLYEMQATFDDQSVFVARISILRCANAKILSLYNNIKKSIT